jgi:hypothetical protein
MAPGLSACPAEGVSEIDDIVLLGPA